jgi:hypothetical protein
MDKLEHLITTSNAISAIRYLLNLDINSLNEKTLRIGIANLIDIDQTIKVYSRNTFINAFSPAKNINPVKQAIDLTKILNDDAKENLKAYLSFSQSY